MTEYVMGIDPHGYDGKTSSVCVMKMVDSTFDTVVHVATYHGRPESDFEAEVKKLMEFYKIPEDHILRQKS